jgi:hypothetical protein
VWVSGCSKGGKPGGQHHAEGRGASDNRELAVAALLFAPLQRIEAYAEQAGDQLQLGVVLAILAGARVECRIYGVRHNIREEQVHGNLRFRPFSEAGFIDDLRTARGVVANGGFTLMSESVYLHRPMLSVPVKGQFEQVLNARYLEREGYGLHAEELSSARLAEFLERIPDLQACLAGYRHDGNRELLAKLDEVLFAAAGSGPAPADED